MSSASRRCCAGASTTSQWRRTSSFRCWRSREIVRVGEWVLREACCRVRRWQQAGQTQLYCAVNLSIRQLQQPGFTDLLARVLRETGLRPDSLLLEITETLLMQDSEATMSSLHEIAALGVRLARMISAPATVRSATSNAIRCTCSRSIAASSPQRRRIPTRWPSVAPSSGSARASAWRSSPKAWSAEQVAFLGAEGCQLVQGYWFSPPRSAAELQRMFDREHRFDELWALHPVTPGTTLNDPLPACLPG